MWQSRMVPSVSLLERLSQMAPPQGEFEIQMEVGPGGMEDGHVAPPQGGSYNAMWQEGGKGGKGHVAPHRPSGKIRAPDFRHLVPCLNFEWFAFSEEGQE